MNNLSSYCGLVDAKIRASDKDFHVTVIFIKNSFFFSQKKFEIEYSGFVKTCLEYVRIPQKIGNIHWLHPGK